MKVIFKWINIALLIGIFFIALGIAYIAIPYFGNQALIVRSGSMTPTIGVGSIIIVHPNKELLSPITSTPTYNKSDIIAFRSENNPKTIITHRVVDFEIKENGVFYKTKGDANNDVDGWLVNEKNILGKTFFTLPFAGLVLAFAKSKLGFPLLIVLPAVLVVLFELFNIVKEIKKRAKINSVKLSFTGLKIFIPLMTIGLAIPIAFAFPTDTEKSANNVFSAAEVFSVNPSPTPTPTISDISPTPTETPTGIADHVVISEVQIAGATTTDEFIEIYNPTSSSINLSTLIFRLHIINSAGADGNKTLTFTNSTIPSHGFFLIGSAADYTGSTTLDATYTTSSGNTLVSNGAVYISTSTATDKTGLIDLIGFGTATASAREGLSVANPVANSSVERKALSTSTAPTMAISGADEFGGNGFDLNDNATDFILRSLSQPQNSTSATETP